MTRDQAERQARARIEARWKTGDRTCSWLWHEVSHTQDLAVVLDTLEALGLIKFEEPKT